MDDLGLKEYQITQHILESDKILPCEDRKFLHISKIELDRNDLQLICDWVISKVKANNHISVRQAYEANIVTCARCNILDSRVLYVLLEKRLSKILYFARYPYILNENHGIVSDGNISFNDMVNDFFLSRNRVIYYKEIYDYFVKERGHRIGMLENICYMCDNIVEYAKDAYVSLETIGWDDKKSMLLAEIATIKFNNCCKAGYPFVSADDLLEEELPKINEFLELSWQKKLLIALLERIDKVKILGNMDSVYTVIPNEYNIGTTDDLIYFILRKEFNGAANRDVFLKRLNALRITRHLDDGGGGKYKIMNEEIIAKDLATIC
jgi:hypothetical protein